MKRILSQTTMIVILTCVLFFGFAMTALANTNDVDDDDEYAVLTGGVGGSLDVITGGKKIVTLDEQNDAYLIGFQVINNDCAALGSECMYSFIHGPVINAATGGTYIIELDGETWHMTFEAGSTNYDAIAYYGTTNLGNYDGDMDMDTGGALMTQSNTFGSDDLLTSLYIDSSTDVTTFDQIDQFHSKKPASLNGANYWTAMAVTQRNSGLILIE